MAEYNMSYEEVKGFVDDVVSQPETSDGIKTYRAEILAALTAKDDQDYEFISVKESLELWENQIGTPSELLLGTRYIIVKDSLLSFIEVTATSGALDAIILAFSNPENPMIGMSISVAASIVSGLIELFQSISRLEDHEFCVYLQAVSHFRTHKKFTLQDLQEWFPHGQRNKCNMHNTKWQCEHILEDDICGMLQGSHLMEALVSLEKKKVLKSEHRSGQIIYMFRW